MNVTVTYNTADGTSRTICFDGNAPTRAEAVREALQLVPDDARVERFEVADKVIN